MEDRQDPSQSVIEEVASLLATGYLRLRNARTLADRDSHQEPVQGLDSAPDTSRNQSDDSPEPRIAPAHDLGRGAQRTATGRVARPVRGGAVETGGGHPAELCRSRRGKGNLPPD